MDQFDLTMEIRSWETRAIIGRNIVTVDQEIAELKSQGTPENEERDRKRKRDKLYKEQAKKDLFAAKRQKVIDNAGKKRDVLGSWKISFPEVEGQYEVNSREINIDIYWEEMKKGLQIYAKFNFGIITSVIRFGFEKQQVNVEG